MKKTTDSPLSLLQGASRKVQPGTWLFTMLRNIQESGDVCYLLDAQRRFIYCNPAWDRFAEANGAAHLTGGSVLGTDLFAAKDIEYPNSFVEQLNLPAKDLDLILRGNARRLLKLA